MCFLPKKNKKIVGVACVLSRKFLQGQLVSMTIQSHTDYLDNPTRNQRICTWKNVIPNECSHAYSNDVFSILVIQRNLLDYALFPFLQRLHGCSCSPAFDIPKYGFHTTFLYSGGSRFDFTSSVNRISAVLILRGAFFSVSIR